MSVFDLELKYAVWIAIVVTAFILVTWKKDNTQGDLTATLLTVIASLLVGVLLILYFIAVKLGATTV
jgi:uncharacterized membrane protein